MPSKNFCRIQGCWGKERGKLRRSDEGKAKNITSIKREGEAANAECRQVSSAAQSPAWQSSFPVKSVTNWGQWLPLV